MTAQLLQLNKVFLRVQQVAGTHRTALLSQEGANYSKDTPISTWKWVEDQGERESSNSEVVFNKLYELGNTLESLAMPAVRIYFKMNVQHQTYNKQMA